MKQKFYFAWADGILYTNLSSAVEGVLRNIHYCLCGTGYRVASEPIIIRLDGGYKVIVIDTKGDIRSGIIKEFIPETIDDAPTISKIVDYTPEIDRMIKTTKKEIKNKFKN